MDGRPSLARTDSRDELGLGGTRGGTEEREGFSFSQAVAVESRIPRVILILVEDWAIPHRTRARPPP